jgi:hypothetical protein
MPHRTILEHPQAGIPVRDDKGALLGHVTDYGWQPVH